MSKQFPHAIPYSTESLFVAHSFGTFTGPNGQNDQIAARTIELAQELPIAADEVIAACMSGHGRPPNYVIAGQSTNFLGWGLGTLGTLRGAREIIEQHGIVASAQVGHVLHLPRIMRGAQRLSMNPIAADGLPNGFDPESTQIWTRSRKLWEIRERVGAPLLNLLTR